MSTMYSTTPLQRDLEDLRGFLLRLDARAEPPRVRVRPAAPSHRQRQQRPGKGGRGGLTGGLGLLPLTVPAVRRLLVALVWTAPVQPGPAPWPGGRAAGRRRRPRQRRAHHPGRPATGWAGRPGGGRTGRLAAAVPASEQARTWQRGAHGERHTARLLRRLHRDGFVVFHDLAVPGNTSANIDHLVIGPTGVFVIDSKQ